MTLTSVSCPKWSCVTPFCSFALRWYTIPGKIRYPFMWPAPIARVFVFLSTTPTSSVKLGNVNSYGGVNFLVGLARSWWWYTIKIHLSSKLIKGVLDVVSLLSTVDYCQVPQGVFSSTWYQVVVFLNCELFLVDKHGSELWPFVGIFFLRCCESSSQLAMLIGVLMLFHLLRLFYWSKSIHSLFSKIPSIAVWYHHFDMQLYLNICLNEYRCF